MPRELNRRAAIEALAAGAASPLLGAAAAPQPTPVVRTKGGAVQGLLEGGVQAFKGLRYGAPPTGARRFKPPEPAPPWSGVEAATGFGAPAMQLGAPVRVDDPLFYGIVWALGAADTPKQDNEDCLFLNIWTPAADGRRRPVMVWLHGGGFATGSGGAPAFDGANLARENDVVVVTLNHRLNVFGYLDLASVAGPAYAGANVAGLLDVALALEWVRDNIAAFGGEPGNVTLFGESGGGYKIAVLMAMPAAAGLFHKAIISSGPLLRAMSRADGRTMAEGLLGELGIAAADVARLHDLTADMILDAAQRFIARNEGALYAPVVDGQRLPRDPFEPDAPALSAAVPLLIGWNKDEVTAFMASTPWFGRATQAEVAGLVKQTAGEKTDALVAAVRAELPDYAPTYQVTAAITAVGGFLQSVRMAERKAAQGRAPAYMYELAWDSPIAGGRFKAFHGIIQSFIFDNIDAGRGIVGDGPDARRLGREISAAFAAFARTGDPSTAALSRWPPYEPKRRSTMIFGAPSRVVDDPQGRIRQVLER